MATRLLLQWEQEHVFDPLQALQHIIILVFRRLHTSNAHIYTLLYATVVVITRNDKKKVWGDSIGHGRSGHCHKRAACIILSIVEYLWVQYTPPHTTICAAKVSN